MGGSLFFLHLKHPYSTVQACRAVEDILEVFWGNSVGAE